MKFAKKSKIKQLRKSNIIAAAITLDTLLKNKYKVYGNSLRETTLNCSDVLPYGIIMALLRINYIRNMAAHEESFTPHQIKSQCSFTPHFPQEHPFDFIRCFEEIQHFLTTGDYLPSK